MTKLLKLISHPLVVLQGQTLLRIQVFLTMLEIYLLNILTLKMRGYQKGRFSFNVKGGRCEACKGDGILKIEMHFLPDVYVQCDVCKGKRYNRETLEVKYRGKSIAEVLEMTVEEALEFFDNFPVIKRKLKTLHGSRSRTIFV